MEGELSNSTDSGDVDRLCAAFLALKNGAMVRNFLRDLCTPAELHAMAERWKVCRLLWGGKYSYREIYTITGVSTATVGRVARCLRDRSCGGYLALLEKEKLEEGK
jgi:TrpR-related protein YerC/YecD